MEPASLRPNEPPTRKESNGWQAQPGYRVTWLPAHPTSGSLSMQKYWWSLSQQFGNAILLGQIKCPLGAPKSAYRLEKFPPGSFAKWLLYPLLVGLNRNAKLIHLLDHSFAHLLRWAPKTAFKIASLHDLAPLTETWELSETQVARFRKSVLNLRSADLILAVSEYSKKIAIAELGLSSNKVRVVPMGVAAKVDGQPTAHLAKRLESLGPYLLSVGSVLKRKNLDMLPAVMKKLRDKGLATRLLRVGAPLPDKLRAELVAANGEGNLVELGRVSEADLAACYRRAAATIIPSRLEGFGLPVLEAMAYGSCVVCSNATSLPEVGGEACAYFSPDDPEEAASRIEEILVHTEFRDDLVTRGRERASRFSWERHRDALDSIYRECSTLQRAALSLPEPEVRS